MNGASPISQNRHDLSGMEVAGFRILRKLGSGGMAYVYLAEQCSLGRQVALKVLHEQLANDPTYVDRFLNEARSAASLVHPNIVQIHEVGQAEGLHFIAQEFVAGKNLAQILERHGPYSPGVVLDILRQVCAALCQAHQVGIVHRDIKPANILFNPSGAVKVADFGLARVLNTTSKTLTQLGVAMGTPLYMSPEQIEGRSVDARSDIYSLGVTTYHLLTGSPPYYGETALAIALKHLHDTPAPLQEIRPELDGELVGVVERMIAKQPADRYESPAALLADLRELSSTAAQAGWATGPEQWSLVEWLASDTSRSKVSSRLTDLMHQESRLTGSSWKWNRTALFCLLAIVVGMLLGVVTRRGSYLEGNQTVEIPERSSPAAQLFHAKMNESEAAWSAVWKYFPEVDSFYKQLAQQGLVRHYLFVSQQYGKAVPILQELIAQSDADQSLELVRAFSYAALTICYEQLGDYPQAKQAYAQLTTTMKDELNQFDSQLYELLQSSLRRLEQE